MYAKVRQPGRYAPCPDCDGLRDARAARCETCYHAHQRATALSLETRFWAKVDRRGPDECWPWTGATANKGHGKIIDGGRLVVATHVALALAGRTIPVGLLVRHTCDNPPCVNPAHLLVGTQADNIHDMLERDRSPSRLGNARVATIKRALLDGARRADLAEAHGVCKATIDHIATGRTWRHVEAAA